MGGTSILPTLGLCAMYLVVGPCLMVLNKEILDFFPHPLLLSSFGLITAGSVAHVGAVLGHLQPRPPGTVDWHLVFPIGACHALTLAAGNAQYLFMGGSSHTCCYGL
jgi:hypothetical protein